MFTESCRCCENVSSNKYVCLFLAYYCSWDYYWLDHVAGGRGGGNHAILLLLDKVGR